MRVFLDFEASSLGDHSYPIEVGWVLEDGSPESHLIRPARGWTDWDPRAEAIHGLSRQTLQDEGEPHDAVARRVLEALREHTVFVSAPAWDGKWMSVLFRSAGVPRHAIRVHDSDEAHLAAAAEVLGRVCARRDVTPLAKRLLLDARDHVARGPPRHRALPDAQQEREVWLEVRRLAEAEAQRLGA
jgi:hypothetical protein